MAGALATAGVALAACNGGDGEKAEDTPAPLPEGAVRLTASGDERQLPDRLFGLACESQFEVIGEDPNVVPPVKAMAPGLIRFPGGTMANYYDWKTGWYDVPAVQGGGSQYRQLLRQWAPGVRQLHPKGLKTETFDKFCKDVGAEMMFVPNLETSTVGDQTAWFADMKSKGIVPTHIELGNEFWVALMNDAAVLKQFPDAPTTQKLMKQYNDALKPYYPEGAKVAIQSSTSRFDEVGKTWVHLVQWDDQLVPEDWFQAVTVHSYPEMNEYVGAGTMGQYPANADKVLPALLARIDAGIGRTVDFLNEKLPGKEIWYTEYHPNGVQFLFQGKSLGLRGVMVHAVARWQFSVLKHPSITVTMMHQLGFRGNEWAVFTQKGKEYVPVGPAGVHTWFMEAGNGGAKYRKVEVEGAKTLPGGGAAAEETYVDVEACLLTRPDKTTLMVSNVSSEAKTVGLVGLVRGRSISKAEAIVTADLKQDFGQSLPPVKTLEAGATVEVPAYSLTRVVWS